MLDEYEWVCPRGCGHVQTLTWDELASLCDRYGMRHVQTLRIELERGEFVLEHGCPEEPAP